MKNVLVDYFSKNYNQDEIILALNKYKFSFEEDKKDVIVTQTPIFRQSNNIQKKSISPDDKLLRDLRTVGF